MVRVRDAAIAVGVALMVAVTVLAGTAPHTVTPERVSPAAGPGSAPTATVPQP